MDARNGAAPAFGLSRQERILDELRQYGSVRVSELSKLLGVAELTVRRDISRLADRGLLTRVHGGATLRSRLDSSVPRAGIVAETPLFRIGMVVPSLTYYWPQIIIGARAAATTGGSQLILRAASYSSADQRRQITSLIGSGYLHGLIVAPNASGPDGIALLHWLASLPIPVVLAERRAPSSLALTSLEWATTDHTHGGILAGEYLASLGHTRVGLVTSVDSPTSAPLRRGWERAVSDLGLTSLVDQDLALEAMEGPDRDDVIQLLLARCASTGTTALLIHSDRQAVLVQQSARDNGWEVPDDLAIMAYDDEVAESAEPPITALRPPKQDVGRVAVELMLGRLTGGATRPRQHTFLLPELKARGSTATRTAHTAGASVDAP
ncbi:substrate-binding domain-containing protein [Microbacterium sp. lyk4-40-TSB-66]|uniref:substrate-binding domain-containing protein n=1 Tax=Microbacterium sp. lyk4-40-TSB-66 TaxID=3040294 RepID=UPI00254C4768|nr:substrate-binding domain-containing protein [Microbacterium sp. lyk4-40-TSB-66]